MDCDATDVLTEELDEVSDEEGKDDVVVDVDIIKDGDGGRAGISEMVILGCTGSTGVEESGVETGLLDSTETEEGTAKNDCAMLELVVLEPHFVTSMTQKCNQVYQFCPLSREREIQYLLLLELAMKF